MDGTHATPRRLVLASSSPRRRQIVKGLAEPVALAAPDVDERRARRGESAEELVSSLSLEKARRGADGASTAVVVGADTVVAVDGAVMGKPGGPREAMEMLRRLRGRTHRVVTGVAAFDGASGRWAASVKTSEVTMRPYSDTEIAAYVATGEPMDKAGAYAVQDGLFRPAASVDGCYLNVVGLPLCEVVTLLEHLGASGRLRAGWVAPAECAGCALVGRAEVASP